MAETTGTAGDARLARRTAHDSTRLPAGWTVIAGKELGDHLSSIRFIILLLLLGLVGVGTVYTVAQSIRDVAPNATGFTGVFLLLFTETAEAEATARLFPFVGLIGLLGPLLGIAFGFDAISSERSEGTLPRLVSQPIHRDDVVNGKFAAGLSVIALVLACATLLVAGVGILRLGVVPRPDEMLRMFAWYIAAVVYVGFWLALATLFSVIFRRAATAALAAFSVWLGLLIFWRTIVEIAGNIVAPVGAGSTFAELLAGRSFLVSALRLSPIELFGEITTVLLNPRSQGVLLTGPPEGAIPTVLPLWQSLLISWPQAVALLALTVVCFAAAYVIFMRQEVRA
jgi:ABC-2 type transport system permease protein